LIPQFCRLDASYGHVLLNDKKGNFFEIPPQKTGLYLNGQTRDILSLKYRKEEAIIFLENNEFPVMYKIRPQ